MPHAQTTLTLKAVQQAASVFAEDTHADPALFGVTDGKAVGTYLEQRFKACLAEKYSFAQGNSAAGLDFPDLALDIKVTSARHPQSSCPFTSARQKIYGLGYHLLVFVYEKTDNPTTQTGTLDIKHAIFVAKEHTGDFQMTRGLRDILAREGNTEDIIAFVGDRNLPVDEIEAHAIADALLQTPPEQGYLTISNALQWRLQYSRAINEAGTIKGLERLK